MTPTSSTSAIGSASSERGLSAATEILATSVTRDKQNRRLATVLEASAAAMRSST